MSAREAEVGRLLEAINEKLNANRPEIAKSIAHGRLSWRMKDGRIELSLDLSL
jgi:hypothetical protein